MLYKFLYSHHIPSRNVSLHTFLFFTNLIYSFALLGCSQENFPKTCYTPSGVSEYVQYKGELFDTKRKDRERSREKQAKYSGSGWLSFFSAGCSRSTPLELSLHFNSEIISSFYYSLSLYFLLIFPVNPFSQKYNIKALHSWSWYNILL